LNKTIVIQDAQTPPSNAVEPSKRQPPNYWLALCGSARFSFCFTLPLDLPSASVFADNAQCAYQLRATAQLLYKGEKATLTRVVQTEVLEAWQDWRANHFWMPVKKEVMERLPGAGGSVYLEASVDPALRWREEYAPMTEGGKEADLLPIALSIKNATTKQVRFDQ
jgi:hypothetical protein